MGLKLAVKLTYDLEMKLKVSFAVKSFRVLPKVFFQSSAQYEGWFGGVIQLPNCRGKLFREFLYHELGHALDAGYEIPESYFKSFTSRNPDGIEYILENGKYADKDRVTGFVSGYARLSRREDFCETFSAWILNGYKTSGRIVYGEEVIDLTKDLRLRRKFEAVKAIAEYCQDIERWNEAS